MDKNIEIKDRLFIEVQDVTKANFILNKKHIVSVGAPMSATPVTRIVMSSGLVVDTYTNIGYFQGWLREIEHTSKPINEQ